MQGSRRARHPALGNVPAAQRHRAQPARTLPDLAEPARPQQDGGAALHHAVERAHSAPAAPRCQRPPDHRDRGGRCAARCRRTAEPAARVLGIPTGADVAIWTLHLEPGAAGLCPPPLARHAPHAVLLCGRRSFAVGPQAIRGHAALEAVASQDWELVNTGTTAVECLLLQGRPIGEPVAQYGPLG